MFLFITNFMLTVLSSSAQRFHLPNYSCSSAKRFFLLMLFYGCPGHVDKNCFQSILPVSNKDVYQVGGTNGFEYNMSVLKLSFNPEKPNRRAM